MNGFITVQETADKWGGELPHDKFKFCARAVALKKPSGSAAFGSYPRMHKTRLVIGELWTRGTNDASKYHVPKSKHKLIFGTVDDA